MKRCLFSVIFLLMAHATLAQECSNDDFVSFREIKTAVLRLLSYPAYTGWDERVLNRAGDLAALAVIRSVSMEYLNSPEKVRQTLLVLNLAFAAPQLIAARPDLRPTGALLLLDYLSTTEYGREYHTEIENTRNEIEHNTVTGRPYEVVTLAGEAPVDLEHAQWVSSVLRWTYDIKPEMTRGDLLKVYTTEGGISTRTRRTYVLKGCPSIKVNVEFAPSGNTQDGSLEDPKDTILKISKPYLDFSLMD
jgi:hypothetical protein